MATTLEFHEALIVRLAQQHGGRVLKDKGEGDAPTSATFRATCSCS